MQERIELNRVRSFGEIIEDSIQFFKQTWKPLLRSYFSICGFFWAASLIISVFNVSATLQHQLRGESIFSLTYFLSLAFEFLNFLMVTLTVICFMSLYKEKGNEPPSVQEVWGFVKYFFFRVCGSYIALSALIMVGFVFCVIPGIYFAVVFSLTLPVIIMENTTLYYAFNRSFQIIKDKWWFTLGIAVVTDIIIWAAMLSVVVPVVIVSYITTFLSTTNIMDVYSYAFVIVSHTAQFLYLLPVIAITLTYLSFTEVKDDGALLQRIMNLGKHDDDSNAEQPLTEEY